jgi:hypothetical protein
VGEGGTLLVAVVCEAEADQRTACVLADRIACEKIDWVEPEHLDSLRHWCGVTAATEFLPWKTVHHEADRLRIVAHGHFSGEPSAPDARAARLALLVVGRAVPGLAAVLLIRDSDGDRNRLTGLTQARDATPWPFAVLIGVAHTKRECWLLAAFCPRDDEEKSRHVRVRQEVGFDPCLRSHDLDARLESAKKSAKRVAGILCPDAGERGLNETPVEVLKERGRENGLADYLTELESRYVPLFR